MIKRPKLPSIAGLVGPIALSSAFPQLRCTCSERGGRRALERLRVDRPGFLHAVRQLLAVGVDYQAPGAVGPGAVQVHQQCSATISCCCCCVAGVGWITNRLQPPTGKSVSRYSVINCFSLYLLKSLFSSSSQQTSSGGRGGQSDKQDYRDFFRGGPSND